MDVKETLSRRNCNKPQQENKQRMRSAAKTFFSFNTMSQLFSTTNHEVKQEKCMTTDVDVPKQTVESNTSELENIEVQKDFMGPQWEEDSSGVKKKNQQSSPGDEESRLQIGAEQNTQNQDKQADISSDRIEAVEVDNMTAIETQHLPPLNSVSEEEVRIVLLFAYLTES